MAEFKITNGLSAEVDDLRSSGNMLNSDYSKVSDENVNTLETAMSYISQHQSIKQILDSYKGLVLKDVQDLVDMISDVQEMDRTLAGKNKK